MNSFTLSRRSVLAGAIAASACSAYPSAAEQDLIAATPPLRSATRMPIGCAVTIAQMQDPSIADGIAKQFSQITPSFEMKMGLILSNSGAYNFAPIDNMVMLAQQRELLFHAHTLVWYKIEPEAFVRLAGSGKPFEEAYRRYIDTIVKRYAKAARGWDVVNEPVMADGEGLRSCIWANNLGQEDYMVRAFEHAAAAKPDGVLFINEYDLEKRPAKRLAFMRLVESLLKKGAPIGGIGTQTHITIDLPDNAMRDTMRDIGSFGLPVHVSELDISFGRKRLDLRSDAEKLETQARLAREVVEAFAALPEKQRYGLTLWGLSDRNSYLRRPPFNLPDDKPLAFDDDNRPKPMTRALYQALRSSASPGA